MSKIPILHWPCWPRTVSLISSGTMNGNRFTKADWFAAVKKGNLALGKTVRKGMAAITRAEHQAIVQRWTGLAQAGGNEVLTIACTEDYPPMSMISASGKPSGMLVDFWRLWSQKTGRKIQFRFFTWEASLAALKEGRADIHSGLFRSGEREKTLGFSKPFYQVESGFFHKRGQKAPHSLADLNGQKVGVEAGTQQLAYLRANHHAIHPVAVPSEKNIIEASNSYGFDTFFAELPYVSAQLERRGEQGLFELLSDGRMTNTLHAGVSKQDTRLLETVNKGLSAITPMERARIEASWIKDPGLRQLSMDDQVPMLDTREKAWLNAHQVIPILGESDWAPLDFAGPDGQYKGVAADYIRLIGKRLGIRFEVITDYTWRQMIEMAKKGETAGITCIAKRSDREAYLHFSAPYFVCPYVIVSQKDNHSIAGITDLYGKKVAIEDGYFLHNKLKSEYPRVIPLPVQNTAAALDAVRNGTADAYIGNLMVIKHLFRKKGIVDLRVTAPSPWPGSKLRIGIRKDWPLLVSALDKAIDSISPEEHRQINRQWLEGPSTQKPGQQLGLTPGETAWLAKNKVMVVASEADWPPVSFVDSQGIYRGITDDYLNLISQRTGLRMEIITDYPWNQMMAMARDRQVDIISAIVKNKDRSAFLNFTDPYFVSPYVIVTQRSHPRIDSITDISDRTIAVEKDFILHQRFQKEYPRQKLLVLDNTLAALEAVAQGRADAYAGNLMVIRFLMKTNGIKGLRVACPAPWPGSRLRLGIRKDGAILATILNKALADITAEEHQAINRKWMDYTPDQQGQTLQLTKAERAWLDTHPDIRLGVDPDWPPFEFISKTKGYSGLASEYIRRMADKLGISAKVHQGLTWSQALEKGSQGEIDLFPCITPSPERARFLNFTRPYLTFPMVIAARTDFAFISSLEALNGRRVAVVKNYFSHEKLASEHKALTLLPTDSVAEGLNLVSQGKADAFAGNLAAITYYAKQMGLTNIKIAAVTPYAFDLCMGVRKDWPQMVAILNKALDAMPETEKNDIRNSWIAMQFDHGMNWALLWKWIAGMTLVSGTILGIILYSNRKLKTEVKERKRIENALRQAEEHSRLILESVGEGIIGQDARGICTFVNRAALEMLGYQDHELLGQPVHETIHHSKPDQTPYPPEACAMCRAGIRSFKGVGDEVIWRKDGSGFQARYSSTWIRNEGQSAGSVIVFKDVTHRKKAEEQLRKLYKAVEQSPVSVVITDPDGTIEYVNPMFTRVTGYTSVEALGQNPRILKSDQTPAGTFKALWDTITSGRAWQGELQNKKKNGALIWEAVNISPIFSGKGEITNYLCVKEDITQRKKMEASLIESHHQLEAAVAVSKQEKRRAEAADKAKSQFLANMSHEIRTPMNAIIGMTHLTLQTDLTPRQQDYVGKIDASAKSLLGLINDILDFSKIEAGKLDMETLEFSLDETLENLAGLILVKAGEKKDLEVLFRVDPDTPNSLVGDPLRLNQVLVNLGNNAVKFTEKGHIIVGVDVKETNKEQAVIRFSVTDSGIGMTPGQQQKLFKAFGQADTSTTRKYGGTGLGLIISKRIVEMMGGSIALDSTYGKGSTFSFTVPLKLGSQASHRRPALDAELAGINVMVIDDNPAARQIFLDMLGAFSLTATGAGSGQEGLALMHRAAVPYNLILVDAHMPGMDGFETAQAIRQLPAGSDAGPGPAPGRTKIVLVCSGDTQAIRSRAEKMALDGILVKPASYSGLFNALVNAFGRAMGTKLVSRKEVTAKTLPREILGARILLVEDHDINQQVAREILEGAGFWVDVAGNGEQGLSQAVSFPFDLVLMDLEMPVMDGYGATRKIRGHKSREELPIIAMTAAAMPKDRQRAMAAGMNDHVSKPIDLNELFKALSKWIKPGNRPLPDGFRRHKKAEKQLSDVPGIAVVHALSRLDRNQSLYLDLLAKFKRDYARADIDLKRLLDNKNTSGARHLAHAVKGVAGNIGMTDLQAAAADMENACRNQAVQDVDALLTAFSKRLAIALSSVDQLCPLPENLETPTGSADIRSAKELADRLLDLAPFVREREAKPAKERMKQISGCAWPMDLSSDVNMLGQLISRYQFKQADELMTQLMTQLTADRKAGPAGQATN